MVLGGVIAASARVNLSCFLDWFPERSIAPALLDELKTLTADVERSNRKDAMSASWAALVAGNLPKRKEEEP